MSWIKLKIELDGRDELLELNYTAFKREMFMRKLHDSIVLREKGITREMPKEDFLDWLLEIISMLDIDDQKELLKSLAEIVYR
jgi:hypothetical protein